MANGAAPTFREIMQWSEDDCREYLARKRWPNGPVCPKCGAPDAYTITRKKPGKNVNRHLYKCKACKRQFSVRAGTIFEDSKIPLRDWFMAIHVMCASKKGMSAHQLHRQLGISYKGAWFMCHRIREAMREKGTRPLLTGTIEADETYVGGKARGARVARSRRAVETGKAGSITNKVVVFGLLQRGGEARTIVIPNVRHATTSEQMAQHIDFRDARLMTDGHMAYRRIRHFLPHAYVDHEREYVKQGYPDVHTQGIESYWAILKRGLIGTFHHVSPGYLPQYLDEFEFRFNRRTVTDAERFDDLLTRPQGRLTWFCRTPQPQNPHA